MRPMFAHTKAARLLATMFVLATTAVLVSVGFTTTIPGGGPAASETADPPFLIRRKASAGVGARAWVPRASARIPGGERRRLAVRFIR